MSTPEQGKESVQIVTPALRDAVLRTAFSYRRSLSPEVKMVDMGTFSDEAQEIRKLSDENGSLVSSVALIDHGTEKLLLSQAKTNQYRIGIDISVNTLALTASRKRRQNKSVGLVIVGVQDEKDAIPSVASLLIEERDLLSPAGVMVVTKDGSHLFFRDARTIEQTREENKQLISQVQGVQLKEFARWNQLRHFYCPFDKTIATPVLI